MNTDYDIKCYYANATQELKDRNWSEEQEKYWGDSESDIDDEDTISKIVADALERIEDLKIQRIINGKKIWSDILSFEESADMFVKELYKEIY